MPHEADGKIEKQGDSFQITLSPRQSSLRKRFSLAHELGHLFLHMGYIIKPSIWKESDAYVDSVYYRYGYSEEEHEANEFAGAFLMPKEEFRQTIEDLGRDGLVDLVALAQRFDVSKDAALTRGRWLGLLSWD